MGFSGRINAANAASGFVTQAEDHEGYVIHDAGEWQATSASGAATANISTGNALNKTCKYWSFTNTATKYIISGSNGPFRPLPWGKISTVKIKLRWGCTTGSNGTRQCRWLIRALQSQTTVDIISTTDAQIRDHANGISPAEPDNNNETKVDEVTISLSAQGWTQDPTAFVISRVPSHGDDDIGNAVILYDAIVMVK